jgi:Domain of unknown function (DUF389)
MSFPEEDPPMPIEPASSEEEPKPGEPTSSEEPPAPMQPASSEETPPGEVVYPEAVLPEDFTPLDRTSRKARARRRRAHRKLVMPSADERAASLDGLARRAFPSFDFFVFALLCGAVLGAAYLMDSPAMLLLAILLAPLLTPWVGLVLAIQTGSWRFFFLTLGCMLVACLLVFLTGGLAGWTGHLWLHLPLSQATLHAHLWWPDLFLVVLGTVLLTVSFIRSENKPVLPSIMLAYGLFMPLSAGGVGWGLGVASIWPKGALVFLVHLALALLAGAITLAALRFKPARAAGHLLPIFMGLLSLAALVYYTGLPKAIRDEILASHQAIAPTVTVMVFVTPTDTPTPTQTATSTSTPLPSATPTPTDTPTPTPAFAIVASPSGGGAMLLAEPGNGKVVAGLTNGIIVQTLPEIQSVLGRSWVHVRWNNTDGWILSTALLSTTETPLPPTPTLTPTP